MASVVVTVRFQAGRVVAVSSAAIPSSSSSAFVLVLVGGRFRGAARPFPSFARLASGSGGVGGGGSGGQGITWAGCVGRWTRMRLCGEAAGIGAGAGGTGTGAGAGVTAGRGSSRSAGRSRSAITADGNHSRRTPHLRPIPTPYARTPP
ncbi:hypothetical protein ACFWP5_24560 [Streptomyces sp. NPDC058469]|uniref:hypothetical protein n=1 Tax=Streptomyces sp. NPDC058469 TaxID=3346514 RepID=UPI0036698CB0